MGPPTDLGPSGSAQVSKWSVRRCLPLSCMGREVGISPTKVMDRGELITESAHKGRVVFRSMGIEMKSPVTLNANRHVT
ncbi:unnamed protein product, partial [Staurois parvus]